MTRSLIELPPCYHNYHDDDDVEQDGHSPRILCQLITHRFPLYHGWQ